MSVATISGGTAIVQALERHGVEVVFGIPGTHNLEIYRGLSESDAIRHVTTRHEQGAGYAADGYARSTGRPGVCVTTSGPGVTNVCTAAATAHADSVPILVIAPGMATGSDHEDTGYLHELRDQQALMASVLDHATRASSIDEALVAIDQAFARWRVGHRRPAYVEVPVDLLEDACAASSVEAPPVVAPEPDRELLQHASKLLTDAERPAVLLGAGALGAGDVARVLAEALDAPVVTTVNAKGLIPESHPLSVGCALRLEPAQELLEDADVLLIVGSRVGPAETWKGQLALRGHVIRVDVDQAAEHKNAHGDVFLHGDADRVLRRLAGMVDRRNGDGSRQGASRARRAREASLQSASDPAAPWSAINNALRKALPGDTIVAGDSSQVSYFGTAHHWPMDRAGRFLYTPNFATLGYGLPAAIGARVGCPAQPVIALIGDGAVMFSIAEMMTAVEEQLPLVIVVANNHGYAEIEDGMRGKGINPLAVRLATPDFAALGRAFGGYGERVESPDALGAIAAEALERDRPTLIEIDMEAANR